MNTGTMLFLIFAALFAAAGFVYTALSFAGALVCLLLALVAAAVKRRRLQKQREKDRPADVHSSLQRLNEACEKKMLEMMKLKDAIKDKYGEASLLFGRQFENSGEMIGALGENLQKAAAIETRYKKCLDRLNVEGMIPSLIGRYGLDAGFPGPDPAGFENAWKADMDKTDEELRDLLLKEKEYETLVKSMANDSEDLQRVDEEMDKLRLRKSQLEDIDASLKIALEVLTEAGTELQRGFTPALNRKMSEIVARITSGKYTDLKADDRLSLKTVEPYTGEIVNSMLLSGGTVDQVYFALRLAMAEMINESQEKLPLIMDEVFSQYDDERTGEALRYLADSYRDRQIILFTCKNREVDIAKKIYGENLNIIHLA